MSTYFFKGNKRFWTPKDEENKHRIGSAQHSSQVLSEPLIKQPETSKWNINMIIRLLRLYAGHENLWNPHDKDFRNRKLRKAALVDIAAAMGNVTTAEVVQKINVLRATYRYEKRRIKQKIKKGVGATTKLKWFALADSFLRNVPRIAIGHKRKDDKSESESDLETMVLTNPEAVIPYDTEQIGTTVMNDSIECYIKTEKKTETSTDIVDSMPKKFKWTSQHSIRFVQLLVSRPELWSENVLKDEESQLKSLESLALQMGISIFDAKRKLQTFTETYYAEILKINKCPDYRPLYKWWELAESFMPDKNHDFVDTNAVIPATPLSISENSQTPFTSINPILSVSVNADESKYDNNGTFMQQTDSSSSAQINKHICNILEDDLLDGKWSLKHSVKFLRLYGAHGCLWDLKNPEYRSRELRTAAIEDIAAAMGHGLNSEYVAKKIKIFRITYMQHRKRMLAAIKAGQEPDIQLRWFPLADSFLRPHIGLRSIKEQELEIPQFNYQYVMANLNLIDPELLNDFRYC